MRNVKPTVAAVVVAGGIGRRLKSKIRKPFVPLGKHPMLVWTLRAFEAAPSIDQIVVVVHRGDVTKSRRLIHSFRLKKVRSVVAGGKTRSGSVFNGLRALPPSVRWVAIHDGARPLVKPELIHRTLKAAQIVGAAIAAIPVIPTIKQAKGSWVARTLERNHLWGVQTPQVFRRDLIERAHAKGRAQGTTATDDSALVEALGHPVKIVQGDPLNFKVTTPEDLQVMRALALLRPKGSDPFRPKRV